MTCSKFVINLQNNEMEDFRGMFVLQYLLSAGILLVKCLCSCGPWTVLNSEEPVQESGSLVCTQKSLKTLMKEKGGGESSVLLHLTSLIACKENSSKDRQWGDLAV